MIVTGAQPVGARALGAVQVTGVDAGEAARSRGSAEHVHEPGFEAKAREVHPVVFVRDGLPMDTRASDLRRERAAQRYREDGGEPPHDERR